MGWGLQEASGTYPAKINSSTPPLSAGLYIKTHISLRQTHSTKGACLRESWSFLRIWTLTEWHRRKHAVWTGPSQDHTAYVKLKSHPVMKCGTVLPDPFNSRVNDEDPKVDLPFESVDETLWCDNSGETAFLQVSLFLDKLFPRKITVPRGQFLHLIVV